MREARAHERLRAREVPREVEQRVRGTDAPAPALRLGVVEHGLGDLDVCPDGERLDGLGPLVDGLFDEDEPLLEGLRARFGLVGGLEGRWWEVAERVVRGLERAEHGATRATHTCLLVGSRARTQTVPALHSKLRAQLAFAAQVACVLVRGGTRRARTNRESQSVAGVLELTFPNE